MLDFWRRLDPGMKFDRAECHALLYLYEDGWITMDDNYARHFAQTLLPEIVKELMAPVR